MGKENEIQCKISRVEEEDEGYSGKLKPHVAWFLWECFRRDVIGAKRYPSVLRRLFIDIPVRIVRKGRRIILKVPFWVYKRLNLEALWKKVQRSPPVSLNA